MLQTLETLANRAIDCLPETMNQIIVFDRMQNTTMLVGSIVGLAIAAWWAKLAMQRTRDNRGTHSDDHMFHWLGCLTMGGLVGIVLLCIAIPETYKSWFAPNLCIIDYLKGLVFHH